MNYSWPAGWWPASFSLRIQANTRSFTGAYAPGEQIIDLLGERFVGTIEMPEARSALETAAREAWADRLNGRANTFDIPHFGAPPVGSIGDGRVTLVVRNGAGTVVPVRNGAGTVVPTVAGDPMVLGAVAQNAGTATVLTRPGRTVNAGAMVRWAGQSVRVMQSATADASGQLTLEFRPRRRTAAPSFSALQTSGVMLRMRLASNDGPSNTWRAGYADRWAIDVVEDVTA